MKLKNFLYSFFWLCLIPAQGHVNTIPKFMYHYDPITDTATNTVVENVAYGSPIWSYEVNNRSNSDERAARFRQDDLINCSLMDFGCNEGGVLFACRKLGASVLIGIDLNAWCIEQAQKKAAQAGLSDAYFFVGDLENKALYHNLPLVDTVFLLAILDTSNFVNKPAILSRIANHTKKALYYEGHVSPESHVKRLYELLLYTNFTRFEYLGRFDGRILIRCSRELLTLKDLPAGAITSDHPDHLLQQANEIYVFTDSNRNPPFGVNCRLIQYVLRY